MTTEPKLFTLAEAQDRFGDTFTAELRERGLIAEEPVDPLLVEARELCAQRCQVASAAAIFRAGEGDETPIIASTIAALRRGMELAPRKELTREMVIAAVQPNVTGESYAINYSAIQAALTEALQ